MRSVSDNGATAPISALTFAFSIGPDRASGLLIFWLKFITAQSHRRVDDVAKTRELFYQ
jgi:hypothetical protein